MRRTKIVATLGPASREPATLRALIEAGTDVFRLNFSHASRDEHAETVRRVREVSAQAGREVGLLGDLPGPKLRIGEIAGEVVQLEAGREFTLTTRPLVGDATRASVSWPGLPEAVRPGEHAYLADGTIRLRVLEAGEDGVRCEIEIGGALSSHKGLNLPGSTEGLPAAGKSDLEWVDFAVEQGIDLIAVSFVRGAADLDPVLERLRAAGVDTPVIAKIEKPQAAERAGEIVERATGGIMVARGDLGIELPIEQVPGIQKRLLKLAGRHAKPSITATQMLASMVSSNRPTRAEATDVANAIHDGTDAVMLSEETAVGAYPVEAVRTMAAIAVATEGELNYGEWLARRPIEGAGEVAGTVAQGAVFAAHRLGLKALIVPTQSGRTARLVSACRPQVPILALSHRIETVRRVNLLFGVTAALTKDWVKLHDLLDECAAQARDAGLAQSGDLVGVTAGLPEQALGTNLFEVHRVP